MAVTFYVPILPAYVRQLGGSLAVAGLVSGAHGLVAAAFRLPAGLWSDRLGRRKPIIVAGFLAGLVSALWFLAATSPWHLFWARAMAGLAMSTWVVMSVFIAAYFPADQLARIMGLTYAMTAASQLTASVT